MRRCRSGSRRVLSPPTRTCSASWRCGCSRRKWQGARRSRRCRLAGAVIGTGISHAGGPALVWFAVWDEPRLADRFVDRVSRPFATRPRLDIAGTLERVEARGPGCGRLGRGAGGMERVGRVAGGRRLALDRRASNFGACSAVRRSIDGARCRGAVRPGLAAQAPPPLDAMVDSLQPYVEGAARLRFKERPKYGWRSEAEIRRYIERSVSEQHGAGPTGRDRAGVSSARVAARHGELPAGGSRTCTSPSSADSTTPETDTLYCRDRATAPGAPGGSHRTEWSHAAPGPAHRSRASSSRLDLENDPVSQRPRHGKGPGHVRHAPAARRWARTWSAYSGLWNWLTASLRLGQGQSAEFRSARVCSAEGLRSAPASLRGAVHELLAGNGVGRTACRSARDCRARGGRSSHPARYVKGNQPVALRFDDGERSA